MKGIGIVFLNVAGAMILSLADFHAAGHGFGGSAYPAEGLPGLIVGATCGGLAALVVFRQINKRFPLATVSERTGLSGATRS